MGDKLKIVDLSCVLDVKTVISYGLSISPTCSIDFVAELCIFIVVVERNKWQLKKYVLIAPS